MLGPEWGRLPRSYQVTPVIPDGGGRHNGRRSGTDADRQTTSQPTAGRDLNRPIGHQHQTTQEHGLSKLRRHLPERRAAGAAIRRLALSH
jgi:hypothetical protein